ncbi:MAG: heavy metal-associated domain-containing protein, partial [Chthoniobacteraceae bacterium]
MSHEHEHGPGDAPKSIALNPDAQGNLETTLRVAGMDCADEVAALEQVFRPLKGVREVRVNLMGGKVTLFHDESVTPQQLIGAVASTGMKAVRGGEDAADLE